MEMNRRDPDQWLVAIKEQEQESGKGQLKIFFGYAAGVGKTYAMLEAAQKAKLEGIHVVGGYIEPHPRPHTAALLEGLEVLPPLEIQQGNITLKEFDLDAAIKRHPEIILVDELAHTNATGCRHSKRYQDIQELLNAGINVYTTVNVQHIESLNDQVAAITGIFVRERIPDSVFDQAKQVELIDIEPGELLARLKAGYIYEESRAAKAMEHFFTVDNLTALREIALRRCADRVNHITEAARIRNNGDFYTDEHILVGLSSSPSNARIIRNAARMAQGFHSRFTALYVESKRDETMSQENKKRLRENMRLATQLGAKVECIVGEDVPLHIVEFAKMTGVSKIVVGRSAAVRRGLFSKPTLTDWLIKQAPNLDIHIIPDAANIKPYHRGITMPESKNVWREIGKSGAILTVGTGICLGLTYLGCGEANLIAVYLLSVLLVAVYIETVKLKKNAKQATKTALRTQLLLDTNQQLQQAHEEGELLSVTARQLVKLLNRRIIMYPVVENQEGKETLGDGVAYPCGEEGDLALCMSENERAVAHWVLANKKHAGATTDTLMNAHCLYLAIRMNGKVYGVVGVEIGEEPLDADQQGMMLSILGESGLALENRRIRGDKEKGILT